MTRWFFIQNTLEKTKVTYYNECILDVNNYVIAEPGNPYGHIEEFIELRDDVKKAAHRVISSKALLLNSYGIDFGTAIDINGNKYYFDVFQDGCYRVSSVIKMKDSIAEEVAYEKYS